MIIVIVGPTGVGKTKLSLALAKKYQTEIISGDSVQIYKGLDIGSAKVTKEEQALVKHHLIDHCEAHEGYSVALYQKDVRAKIADFEKRNIMPLIVGGTGFYIKSVLHDFDFEQSERNEDFENKYDEFSNALLHKALESNDPETARNIHPNNRKRVLQALFRAKEGTKISEVKEAKKLYDYVIIGLTMDREKLYRRIDERVDLMFKEGLIEEVQSLHKQKLSLQARQAIGYKELFDYFDGKTDLSEAKRLIKRNSRRYAKRQYTYFNNQLDITWIDVDVEDFDKTIQTAFSVLDYKLKTSI